jgi:hydroxymethylglutaryl-CoA lyase
VTLATDTQKIQLAPPDAVHVEAAHPWYGDGVAVRVVEVGPRDGLQSYDRYVPTACKVELIERLVAAGLTEIEATGFAHPKVVSRLADGAEVLDAVPRVAGVRYRALVPDASGALRAIEAGADLVVAVISASAEYSERNEQTTIDEALERLGQISAVAHEAGIGWVAGVSMAFGSPYRDEVRRDDVLRLVERCVALRPEQLYVADTVGVAAAGRVRDMCAAIRGRWPELPLGVHLRSAGGRGLGCVIAAVLAGAADVETSICGLGGPAARRRGTPRVRNLATETVVAGLAELGIDTGVDPGAVRAAAQDVAELLAGRRRTTPA